MSTYLVTGGAGFIGSNVVHALVERGETVRVLDDLSTGSEANLVTVRDQVALTVGDIRDRTVLDVVLKGCDYVLHLAAIPAVVRSVEDPERTHDVNVNGTLALFERARSQGVRRVVFSGSSSVYGNTEVLPKVETMTPAPRSPYALQKLSGESYARMYTVLYGLDVVTLRYFNVFGPRQSTGGDYPAVIPSLLSRMRRGEAPVIYGDGRQTRDFCFVENVVDATLRACSSIEGPGRIYNVGCGQQVALLEVVAQLNHILGTSLDPQLKPVRPGDVLHSVADIQAAGRDLGYIPPVHFSEGLRRTVEWHRS